MRTPAFILFPILGFGEALLDAVNSHLSSP